MPGTVPWHFSFQTKSNTLYRKAKAEKEELSIVKANIDAILKQDHQKTTAQER